MTEKMQNPTPRVDVVCSTCGNAVARFYLRDGRLTVDSRHPASRLQMADGAPVTTTEHQQWFRGIDVADELDGVTDSSLQVECSCRIRDLSVAQTADKVRQVWDDQRRVTRLPV